MSYKATEAETPFPHLLAPLRYPALGRAELLKRVVEEAVQGTRSNLGALILPSSQYGEATVIACPASLWQEGTVSPKRSRGTRKNSADSFLGSSSTMLLSHDGGGKLPLPANSRSLLSVPLRRAAETIGVLQVASSRPRHYGEQRVRHLRTVAATALLVLDRVLLQERAERMKTSLDLVGVSPAFLDHESRLKRAACSSDPVLLVGPRGSGKEAAARAIHFWSRRWNRPFVPVLVSALPETLVCAELFGHQRHAFTGATQARAGRFRAAEGGTLFLDEIAELPLSTQALLLRVLEYGEVQVVGRDLPVEIDVRLIAATNQDLGRLASRGQFREDLYDRLRVLELRTPSLAERREDIPLLAEHFLGQALDGKQGPSRSGGKAVSCQPSRYFTDACREALQGFAWPGNVRQLRNLMRRLAVFNGAGMLGVADLPEEIRGRPLRVVSPSRPDLSLDSMLRSHLQKVLSMTHYNQTQAARLLGLSRSTLRSMIKRLQIEPKEMAAAPAAAAWRNVATS